MSDDRPATAPPASEADTAQPNPPDKKSEGWQMPVPKFQQTSGYLPQAYVIALAEGAGFELVATSEVNANPKDTKDYKEGVWTLPPTLTLGEQDKARYLEIGESDRMTLKFRKP